MNIVQIVGGSGSGKTTLVFQLLADWPGTASVMRLDRYLRDRQPEEDDAFFLLPTSLDWPLVLADLDVLAGGSEVIMPLYDWARGKRLVTELPCAPEQVIKPCDWLIIEGLFYVPGIESIRLFVDAPADVRRARSQARQTNLSLIVGGAYDSLAEPAYQTHILPQRERADYVLDGRLDQDTLADQARRHLATHGGGWG
jgi:uridine kinase